MRSRIWVALDCGMLLAIVVLQAWRLTGVVLHEWLAVAIVAAALLHLLLHWPWVRWHSRRILRPRSGRTRVNYALNAIVLVTIAAAMISGFAISKVLVPAHIDAETYLKWHSIHDLTARLALIAVGLHLALNWDRIFAGARARLQRRFVVPVLVSVAIASAVVGAATWAIERGMPAQTVTFIRGDGKRFDHVAPPPDIVRIHRGDATPSIRGLPALVAQGVILAVVCVVGRKVLRLRLR